MRLILGLFLAYSLLDVASTYVALGRGGTEGNPLAAWLLGGAPWAMPAFKLGATAIVVAAVLGLARWFPRVGLALRIGSVILALVVLLNVGQMALYW